MKKGRLIYWLFFALFFFASCKGQNRMSQNNNDKEQIEIDVGNDTLISIIDTLITDNAPSSITRTIIQDKRGNIWFATFEGIFKFDGSSFANVLSEVSQSRFFSALEDRAGNLWFGSIGSGVYLYDGNSFQNFTTLDGLLSNEIVCIYQDKFGSIWFGTNGGASKYDGKYFRNFIIKGDSMFEAGSGFVLPDLDGPINEVNSIVEDETGNLWFGTRGFTFICNGKTFTTVKQNNKYFTNVRWIIEDKNENIWLGGKDGLWRYDGITFINISTNFVGYIYEDSKGNIWTSSQSGIDRKWMLTRYDEMYLSNGIVLGTEINSEYDDNRGMMFGILEAHDESIWFGALNGAYRYDGNVITFYKDEDE